MRKSIFINPCWYLGGLLLIFATGGLHAGIERIEIQVDGLACPFCVYGLEKKLRAVDGVNEVEVSLKNGTAILQTDSKAVIHPAGLETAVKKAGFKAREIRYTATGAIHAKEDAFVLLAHHTGQEFLLHSKSADDRHAIIEAQRQMLEDYAEMKAIVSVTGTVHQHQDQLPALAVEDIKVVGN